MDKKPNVFPSKDTIEKVNANREGNKPVIQDEAEYNSKKIVEIAKTYSKGEDIHQDAIEVMRQRTEEQIRLRDEKLKQNSENIDTYQKQFNEASKTRPTPQTPKIKEVVPVVKELTKIDDYIKEISQPQYSSNFDVLPLPSKGKIYRNKKPSVKVSYMTTSDENILTSPNLLKSGQFLEILINRKLLENGLRYNDLHIGDMHAIMIWLRSTAYGHMYPVTLLDENDVAFETQINLDELNIKYLEVDADKEGLFDYTLPLSKDILKFKLLTVGDINEIQDKLKKDADEENPVNYISTYTLQKQIVEFNGSRDENMLKQFIDNIRIMDSKSLREYINEIESGVELYDIKVSTPGGGTISTFLPLNFRFLWPNAKL